MIKLGFVEIGLAAVAFTNHS